MSKKHARSEHSTSEDRGHLDVKHIPSKLQVKAMAERSEFKERSSSKLGDPVYENVVDGLRKNKNVKNQNVKRENVDKYNDSNNDNQNKLHSGKMETPENSPTSTSSSSHPPTSDLDTSGSSGTAGPAPPPPASAPELRRSVR